MVVLYSNKDGMSNLDSVHVLKSCVEKLKVFSQNSALTLQSLDNHSPQTMMKYFLLYRVQLMNRA